VGCFRSQRLYICMRVIAYIYRPRSKIVIVVAVHFQEAWHATWGERCGSGRFVSTSTYDMKPPTSA